MLKRPKFFCQSSLRNLSVIIYSNSQVYSWGKILNLVDSQTCNKHALLSRGTVSFFFSIYGVFFFIKSYWFGRSTPPNILTQILRYSQICPLHAVRMYFHWIMQNRSYFICKQKSSSLMLLHTILSIICEYWKLTLGDSEVLPCVTSEAEISSIRILHTCRLFFKLALLLCLDHRRVKKPTRKRNWPG